MLIFSIRDSKAEAFMQPFFVQAEGVAKREFGNLVADKTHAVGRHPEDYTLMMVGTWNEVTGNIEHVEPKSFGNGIDFGGLPNPTIIEESESEED